MMPYAPLVGSVGAYIKEIIAILDKKPVTAHFTPNDTETTTTIFFFLTFAANDQV